MAEQLSHVRHLFPSRQTLENILFDPFGWSCIDSLKQTFSAVYTRGALSDQNLQYSKRVSEGAVIFNCRARCNNLAGKWCSLSDRQSREITKTILSGGSFITAYPPAWPAPSFLFSPFVYKGTSESMCSLTLNIECALQNTVLGISLVIFI